MFHTELGDVLRVFSVMEDKEKIQEMLEKHPETYSAVDEESAKVLQECAKIRLVRNEEIGGYDMCKGFEDMKQEGIDIGVDIGVDKLAGLITWLQDQNRINEALEVARDAVLREKLFVEKKQSETGKLQN